MDSLFSTIVLGGNVVYPRGSQAFDFIFLDKVSLFITSLLNKGQKVVIVPGGLGGQLYFENARRINCSEAELNIIGTKIIEIASLILTRHFRESLTKENSTRVARFHNFESFKNEMEFYEISVVGFTLPGATTSDSLAALISSDIRSTLYFIKNEKSESNITEKIRIATSKTISIAKIFDYCTENNFAAKAGENPLDLNAFRLIRQNEVESYVVYKEDLMTSNFPEGKN